MNSDVALYWFKSTDIVKQSSCGRFSTYGNFMLDVSVEEAVLERGREDKYKVFIWGLSNIYVGVVTISFHTSSETQEICLTGFRFALEHDYDCFLKTILWTVECLINRYGVFNSRMNMI